MPDLFIPDCIEIHGGKKLNPNATVEINGAKNEVLGAMAAAVLTDKPVTLRNVPYISDVLDMGHMMMQMGVDVGFNPDERIMRLHARNITQNTLPDNAYKFRASYYIWGALMARFAITGEFNRLNVKVPGGCFSTDRGLNYHFNLMRNVFGARISKNDTGFSLVLPRRRPANTNPIYSTPKVSHGATFHWMLAASTQNQTKMIYNASLEPEVGHLLSMLNKMGANLRGSHSTAKMSNGAGKLLNGVDTEIMPDRLESGSYALLAMAMRDKITLTGTHRESCLPWLNSVLEIVDGRGVDISPDGQTMRFDFTQLGAFAGQRFLMSPIPGKETDMQQIWTPVLATASSASEIYDPIWPTRRAHLSQLAEFGLASEFTNFKIKNSVAKDALKIIIHPSQLHATSNAAGMDLRGTFALIIAAAMSNGPSLIKTPSYALRGYANLVENLGNIGIDVHQSSGGVTVPALPRIKPGKHR